MRFAMKDTRGVNDMPATALKSNSVNHVRLFRLTSVLIGLFIFLSAIPAVIYWYPGGVWPFNPVDFLAVEGIPKEIKAGDALKWTLHLNKYTKITPIITRYLICQKHQKDEIVLQPLTPGGGKIANHQKVIRVEIPKWLADEGLVPDQCHVRNVARYEYFGFKPVEEEYLTPCFEVVK